MATWGWRTSTILQTSELLFPTHKIHNRKIQRNYNILGHICHNPGYKHQDHFVYQTDWLSLLSVLWFNTSQRCKDSIPFRQFLRVRQIYTLNSDLYKNPIDLCKHFLRRKHPLELLRKAALLVHAKDRRALLDPTNNPTCDDGQDKIFLISTYHSHDQFIPKQSRQIGTYW